MVRNLGNNMILAKDGIFRWDGLDDEQNLLPMGHYIIYTSLFSLNGMVKIQKTVITLARKS